MEIQYPSWHQSTMQGEDGLLEIEGIRLLLRQALSMPNINSEVTQTRE